jgi:uncharacterized protein (DUF433 family)
MNELLAFTADHVCRLSGLSKRQLSYWDETEFFSPEQIGEPGRRTFSRIYTFRDLVGLRTLAILRNEHKIPLQELRRVGAWLREHYESPWASLAFGLNGKRVVFKDPTSGAVVEPRGGGQTVLAILLKPIANAMHREAAKLTKRSREDLGGIVRNRYVVHNAWVVAGTRIPTRAIKDFHAAGYSTRAIIREFPRLTPTDVRSALAFVEPKRAA